MIDIEDKLKGYSLRLVDTVMSSQDFIQNRYGYCYYAIDKVCVIYNLYIHQVYRRQGHAKRILHLVINEIRKTGYRGVIEVEASPRDSSINLDDLVLLYEDMGLKVLKENNNV